MSKTANTHSEAVKRRRVSEEAALRYVRERDPRRYKRTAVEERIVRGWLSRLPPHALIWDCPCGTGRFVKTAVDMGFRYVGGDFSQAMIGHAGKASQSPQVLGFVSCDAQRLPLRNESVDCVLLWRLLHHIEDAAVRQQMLREAARVTRSTVLVSFHHPLSAVSARCWIQRKFLGDNRGAAAITHWRLRREAAACGLDMVETKSFGKFRSVNWFACLAKRDGHRHRQ